MEIQGTQNTQSNLVKREQSYRTHTLQPQSLLEDYSNQNSMVFKQG